MESAPIRRLPVMSSRSLNPPASDLSQMNRPTWRSLIPSCFNSDGFAVLRLMVDLPGGGAGCAIVSIDVAPKPMTKSRLAPHLFTPSLLLGRRPSICRIKTQFAESRNTQFPSYVPPSLPPTLMPQSRAVKPDLRGRGMRRLIGLELTKPPVAVPGVEFEGRKD